MFDGIWFVKEVRKIVEVRAQLPRNRVRAVLLALGTPGHYFRMEYPFLTNSLLSSHSSFLDSQRWLRSVCAVHLTFQSSWCSLPMTLFVR